MIKNTIKNITNYALVKLLFEFIYLLNDAFPSSKNFTNAASSVS